jgi:hypothetical protein
MTVQPPDNGNNRSGLLKDVTSDVVGIFKSSPGMLVIVLLNVMFIGGLGYLLLQIGDRRAAEFKFIVDMMNSRYEDILRLCTK